MTKDELKALRHALALTTTQLGEKLGVSRRTIEGYEMGRRKIPRPVEMLINLLKENAMKSIEMPADKTIIGQKWNSLSVEARLQIVRKHQPDGSWDFYAQSTWGNLFGGVQDRFEQIIQDA